MPGYEIIGSEEKKKLIKFFVLEEFCLDMDLKK